MFQLLIYLRSIISKYPKWYLLMRKECRPIDKKVWKLEDLRKANNIPHEIFSVVILGSPATTKQLQKYGLEELRRKRPTWAKTEKDLWIGVLVSRLQGLVGLVEMDLMSKTKIEREFKNIDKTIEKMSSFDELCDYIVNLDEDKKSDNLLYRNLLVPDSVKMAGIAIKEILESD